MTFIYTPPEPAVATVTYQDVYDTTEGLVRWNLNPCPEGYLLYDEAQLRSEVERVRRETVEECAKVCRDKSPAEYATGKVDHNEMAWVDSCAIDILELLK